MTDINWSNFTSLGQFPQAANTASNDTFWIAALMLVFIVLLLLLMVYGFEVALTVSSFLSFIIGLFLTYADLLNWTYNLIFVGIMLFMLLYITWVGNKNR
jgi:hypothetical protein